MKNSMRFITSSPTFLLGAILVLAAATSAFAQAGSTGAITGSVRDEKGAGVPNATIEIVNVTGVTERTATSDSNGNFNAQQLSPGTYKLVVSAPGFSKAEVDRKSVV